MPRTPFLHLPLVLALAACTDTPVEPERLSADAAAAALVAPQAASASGALDRIAFEDAWDIWVVNEDGTGLTRVTSDPAEDRQPGFSRDGRKIAFSSVRDGNFEIYVINDDGTAPARLTNHAAEDGYPAFSPDGSRIVFESDRDGDFDIYVLDLATGVVGRLTGTPGPDAANDHHPEFSPDGGRVTFFRSDFDPISSSPNAIWVIDLATAALTQVSFGDLQANGFPTFSPDGERIAFQGFLGSLPFQSDVWIANADGSGGFFNASDNPDDEDGAPSYDLDEDRIAFASTYVAGPDPFDTDIYLMNEDGTGVTRIADTGGFSTNPSFGPPADPATIEDCMNGEWEAFGFANQGQCVRFVKTGKDSR